MGLLDGKVAVVTGAGGGIGREHALALAKEGAAVVVNDHGGARDGTGGGSSMADEVAPDIKALGLEAVANYDNVATVEGGQNILKTALETFDQVDVLINNAGILRDKSLANLSEELWDVVVSVHLRGTYCVTQPTYRHMKERGGGGCHHQHLFHLGSQRQLRSVQLRRRQGRDRGLHALPGHRGKEVRRTRLRAGARRSDATHG
jgi:NAD(P)-dependent dehydrogenase (short-subunit alcohol dehydrogenase family)